MELSEVQEGYMFDFYPGLPEPEGLTMQLSEASGIQTVPDALINLYNFSEKPGNRTALLHLIGNPYNPEIIEPKVKLAYGLCHRWHMILKRHHKPVHVF